MWGRLSELAKSTAVAAASAAQSAATSIEKGAAELGHNVSQGSKQLAQTVQASISESKSSFSQEQAKTARIKAERERLRDAGQAYPLWTVFHEDKAILEEELKRQILAISDDPDAFMTHEDASSPEFEVFPFSMDTASAWAIKALQQDRGLQLMRHKLVPKRVKEDAFWKHYFFRVTCLREKLDVEPLPLLGEFEHAAGESGGSRIEMTEHQAELEGELLDQELNAFIADEMDAGEQQVTEWRSEGEKDRNGALNTGLAAIEPKEQAGVQAAAQNAPDETKNGISSSPPAKQATADGIVTVEQVEEVEECELPAQQADEDYGLDELEDLLNDLEVDPGDGCEELDESLLEGLDESLLDEL